MKSKNCLISRSTWVHPRFLVGSCCLIFSFLCNVLLIIVCNLSLFGRCIVCSSSIYGLWLFLWCLQAFLIADLCYILCITWTYYYTFYIHAITFILLWRGNQKRAIQGTQDETKQNKSTMQYVLDTTMRKQTQIT
jgi:hypothetical protein